MVCSSRCQELFQIPTYFELLRAGARIANVGIPVWAVQFLSTFPWDAERLDCFLASLQVGHECEEPTIVDVEDCDEQAVFDVDLQNMTRFHPRWGAGVSAWDEAPVVSSESEEDVVKDGPSVSATWTFPPLSTLRPVFILCFFEKNMFSEKIV